MSSINTVLNASPVFNSLGAQDIENLAGHFDKRDTLTGDMIATAGDLAQFFYLLAEGTLLLEMKEGKSVVLNQPGDFIAMELLSAQGMYQTSVHVLEKGAVFAISREKFLEIIQEDSPAAGRIMASWQDYLGQTAPFAAVVDDTGLMECF
jgi:CRP-like cAMP-binding protein